MSPVLRSRSALAALLLSALLVLPAGARAAGSCPRFAPASDGLPTSWEWRTHPALGDVNGDGHLDIAANPRKGHGPMVWLGDGRGHWTRGGTGLALPGPACGVGVALADVNHDGALDLGVADHCHGLFVFLGSHDGPWRLAGRGRHGERRGHEDLAFGDLDRDGHMDVVSVGSFHGGLQALRGDGKGNFTPMNLGLPSQGMGRDVKLADLNGDGVLDVVASFIIDFAVDVPETERNALVWLSGPDGRYHQANAGIETDRQYRGVAVGDVNGDGHPDLAASALGYKEGDGPLHIYLGDGAGHWTRAGQGLPGADDGSSFSGVELADLDHDGHLDLVATSWLDAALRVWMGDGTGGFHACANTGLPSGRTELRGWGVAVGDVNEDGRPDLAAAFGRRGAGTLEVWVQR